MILRIDAQALLAGDRAVVEQVRVAARSVSDAAQHAYSGQ
jgi:hypothetical protein